jgi:pyridoxamine 5'-phosphate oxidase
VEQLTTGDRASFEEPFRRFDEWFAEAEASEPSEAEAMSLATADADGLPDVRMVLLKAVDRRGFVFYTNSDSVKGCELADNPQAALAFHWKSLRRQVRVRGSVDKVSEAEADAYFASRARDSRIGAWASLQSQPMENRLALEIAVAKYAARFALGDVPRPPRWTGYRVAPLRIEFWRDRPFRLHERISFRRARLDDEDWIVERLYP